jgi:hypothetical protein
MKKACQFISLETNKINLDNLIENIYVSPYVDDYFIEGINSLIENMIFLIMVLILLDLYYKNITIDLFILH